MAYSSKGYPTELANKVGHIKLIEDPLIKNLIREFEETQRRAVAFFLGESQDGL